MSIGALNWALHQHACSSSAKFVLVVLAQYAGEAGDCHPSQAELAEATLQSAETVRKRLQDLETAGLIYRIGRGRTEHGYYGRDGIIVLCNEACRAYAATFGWREKTEKSRLEKTPALETGAGISGEQIANPPVLGATDPKLEGTTHPKSEGATDPKLEDSQNPPEPDGFARPAAQEVENAAEKADGTDAATRGAGISSSPARAEIVYNNNYIKPFQKVSLKNPEPDQSQAAGLDEPAPDLWPKFEKLWPWEGAEPFEPARRSFHRLSPAEKVLALQWVPAFVAAQKAKGKRLGQARRYLSDKKFEPFASGVAKAAAKPVFVIEGTPAFDAWLAVWRAENGNRPLFRADGKNAEGRPRKGIWRATLFPPRAPNRSVNPREEDPPDADEDAA